MSIIGNFTKQENGYQGTIATLTLKSKVNIVPVEKTSEKAPDFRVFAKNVEIGAAWSQVGKESNNSYLSIKLDDPSFAAAILCRLVKTENGHSLVWTR